MLLHSDKILPISPHKLIWTSQYPVSQHQCLSKQQDFMWVLFRGGRRLMWSWVRKSLTYCCSNFQSGIILLCAFWNSL